MISKHQGQPHRSQRGRLLPPLAAHLGQRPGPFPCLLLVTRVDKAALVLLGEQRVPKSSRTPQGFGERTARPTPDSRWQCRCLRQGACTHGRRGGTAPWQLFPGKAMWGHALGKDVSLWRKSRVWQEGAAGGRAHGKGQERVRAAAMPACGGHLRGLRWDSGCCSMCREEGCGHSCITLPGTGRWHGQHGAAGGEQCPVLALPAACLLPPSPGLAPLAPCKQTAGLCAVQTRRQATQTPSQQGRLVLEPTGPGQDSAPGAARRRARHHDGQSHVLGERGWARAGPWGADTCLVADGPGAEAEELEVLDLAQGKVAGAHLPINPTIPKSNQTSPVPVPCPTADSWAPSSPITSFTPAPAAAQWGQPHPAPL